MPRSRPPESRAFTPGFTLVELLVVIGIIAVLLGVLLPVIAGVQARGRDLACQSNVRQAVTLLLAYAAENGGQLPYGYYWTPAGGHPYGWGLPPTNPPARGVTMWAIVSRMTSSSYDIVDYFSPMREDGPTPNNSAPFLRCPEAMLVHPHRCTYAGNMTAFVTPAEAPFHTTPGVPSVSRDGPAWMRFVERPTKLNQLLPFNALVWETTVTIGMEHTVGFVVGADIDGQRIWEGAVRPQQRYYSAHDPFARSPPGIFGNNKPVQMDVAGVMWFNIDPAPNRPDGLAVWPYQGNLRFRHRKNTTCNVGFADGHVGQFTGRFRKDGRLIAHDALRKHFLIKWPSGIGIGPDPSAPH